MAIISPFRALRPEPQYAKQLASRPYDVLNTNEARSEANGNPYSFLHITKSEIGLPEGTDIHSEQVYLKAKENLDAFVQRGILFRESKPCYYLYQLVMNGKMQTGIVCGSAVNDYEKGVIKKHEFTRPEKEQDRINHIATTGAQTGNVFLAYRNVEELTELVNEWKDSHGPIYDFELEDGIRHTLWVVNKEETIDNITRLFKEKVPETYIADGHHRAASAAKVRAALKTKTPEAEFFLTTLFPDAELQILDYNRVVTDLNGNTPTELLQKLEHNFIVSNSDPLKPEKPHEFGMYLNGKWYKLEAKPGSFDDNDPVGVLDVTILSENLLKPLLGIADQRTDKRIDFVGGIRGIQELVKKVDSGEFAVAFSIYPVTMKQLFDIADSGQVMPPKSTWFEPKLRDGLLTHLLSTEL